MAQGYVYTSAVMDLGGTGWDRVISVIVIKTPEELICSFIHPTNLLSVHLVSLPIKGEILIKVHAYIIHCNKCYQGSVG